MNRDAKEKLRREEFERHAKCHASVRKKVSKLGLDKVRGYSDGMISLIMCVIEALIEGRPGSSEMNFKLLLSEFQHLKQCYDKVLHGNIPHAQPIFTADPEALKQGFKKINEDINTLDYRMQKLEEDMEDPYKILEQKIARFKL